jgi:non-haem dioxygenase in morphine synthesis N-terminal
MASGRFRTDNGATGEGEFKFPHIARFPTVILFHSLSSSSNQAQTQVDPQAVILLRSQLKQRAIMSPSALPVEPANIPVVDFSLLVGAQQERVKALQQLDDALATYGFIYLSNHGIPQDMIDDAFSWVMQLSYLLAY